MTDAIIHLPKEFSEKYWVEAPIRWYKIDDNHYFVSTDWGWDILEADEFKLLKEGKIEEDSNLFKRLEEKGLILTKDNFRKAILRYKERYGHLWQGPSLHIVTVTRKCNQACIYCHSAVYDYRIEDKKKYDMDENTAKAVVDFIFQTNAKSIGIEFQGGEPLLNWDVVRFTAEYAVEKAKIHQRVVDFNLATNLTLMEEEIANYIINNYWKNGIKFGFSTSLDGPKEVHDKNRPLRGGGSSYDRVVYWLEWFWEKHKWVPNAMLTLTKFSLPYWKEIVDEYIKRHQVYIWFRMPNRIGYAKGMKYNIEPDEYLDFFRKGLDYIIDLNKKGVKIKELMTLIILRKLYEKQDPLYTDLMCPTCGGIIGQLSYTPDGYIHTCDEGKIFEEFRLGHVKTHTLKDIMQSPEARAFLTASFVDNYPSCWKCPFKPFCGTCPVNSYAEFGTIFPRMPEFYRCHMSKAIFDTILKRLVNPEKKEVLLEWLKTYRPVT